MKWIDIKDKLPKDCENVLVYMPILDSCTVAYLIYSPEKQPIHYAIVDFDEYEQSIDLNDISHWMPLPKLPNKEEK